jgi:hypothetical protein
MEPMSPTLRKLRLFFVASIGFVLLEFANMDVFLSTLGAENGAGLTFFLFLMGLLYGWFVLGITLQKGLGRKGGIEYVTYLTYLVGFTALWLWSSWLSISAKIFNWVVGIILFIIVIVNLMRRKW